MRVGDRYMGRGMKLVTERKNAMPVIVKLHKRDKQLQIKSEETFTRHLVINDNGHLHWRKHGIHKKQNFYYFDYHISHGGEDDDEGYLLYKGHLKVGVEGKRLVATGNHTQWAAIQFEPAHINPDKIKSKKSEDDGFKIDKDHPSNKIE